MRTIITHFYNEEYILPWWLEHHKKYFDEGILINYGSTDRSVDIIKKICPNWYVFPSKFPKFDCHWLEYEMMWYERQVKGWRIALPTSEFVVGDIFGLTPYISERLQWIIPTIVFSAYDPKGSLDQSKPLWNQITTGRHYKDLASKNAWQCRSLHNYNDIFYNAGRHFSNENTERVMIFKYSNVLIGDAMIKRKLQIQEKVSDNDKRAAVTHTSVESDKLTEENLLYNLNYLVGEPYDCSKYINSIKTFL